jgi:hypothetical protein
MRRCLVGESKQGRSNEWDVRAVFVHSGAEGLLVECALMRAAFGLWIEGAGTRVDGSHCKVRNNTRCGVLVAAGASVELLHCMAVGSKEFHGIEVRMCIMHHHTSLICAVMRHSCLKTKCVSFKESYMPPSSARW